MAREMMHCSLTPTDLFFHANQLTDYNCFSTTLRWASQTDLANLGDMTICNLVQIHGEFFQMLQFIPS